MQLVYRFQGLYRVQTRIQYAMYNVIFPGSTLPRRKKPTTTTTTTTKTHVCSVQRQLQEKALLSTGGVSISMSWREEPGEKRQRVRGK